MDVNYLDFNGSGPLIMRMYMKQTELSLEAFATKVNNCIVRKLKEKGYATLGEVCKEVSPDNDLGIAEDLYGWINMRD